MTTKQPQFYFLFTILLAVATLTFFVFKPFIAPLVLAVVFAVAFKPVHKKILRTLPTWESLAAFVSLVAVVVLFIVPLTILGIQIAREAAHFYGTLSADGANGGVIGVLNDTVRGIQSMLPFGQNIVIDLDEYVKQGLQWILGNAGVVAANLAQIMVSFFVFLMALFYLFKDGSRIRRFVITLSPLGNSDDEDILNKLEASTNSVVRGGLLIALIQGILVSVGFMIFGVPNPMLWGSTAAIAALVPGVGTMLVLIPAILYLLVVSGPLAGFGLMAYGIGIVGLVDNMLAPQLLGRGSKLHPLLVLLSVLGGLIFFGPIGIFLGPLIISLLIALLDLHFLMANGKTH